LARGDREWPLNNVTHATPYGDSFWLLLGAPWIRARGTHIQSRCCWARLEGGDGVWDPRIGARKQINTETRPYSTEATRGGTQTFLPQRALHSTSCGRSNITVVVLLAICGGMVWPAAEPLL
jgi:hypothetical protein